MRDFNRNNLDQITNSVVYDVRGSKLGKIKDIYLDDQTQQPTFVHITAGLMGMKDYLIPTEHVHEDGADYRVDFDEDFVKGAPDVDVDRHISDEETERLREYFRGGQRGDLAMDGRDHRDGVVGGAPLAHQERTDMVDDRDRAYADRTHEGREDGSMVLHEEEVRVGTQREEVGEVRLQKHVVTERQTVEVPVEREEVHVVREPLNERVAGEIHDNGAEEVAVTLHEDRPVVSKETVAVERIGLDKEVHRGTETVTAEVRKEEAELVRDGDVVRGHEGRDFDGRDIDGNGRMETRNPLDRDNDGRLDRDDLRKDPDHDGKIL